MKEFWDNLMPHLINGGLRLLGAIVIVAVGWYLIKWIERLLKKGKAFHKMEETARGFLISVISVALKVALIMTAVATLGVNMTGMVTLLGSCGVAIGLALQGSLANFAGGILILVCHPFRVGDFIESGGNIGTVNGGLSNATVINYSAEDLRRVDLDFNVDVDTDVERVKKVLLLLAERHELVLENPAPFARMTGRGDSSLTVTLRAWVKKDDYWQVRFDLLEQVKDAFEKLEIVVPFPQMDVHMHQ